MEIIRSPIAKQKIGEKYMSVFKNVVKAVVDVNKEVLALDGELHADLERLLLENDSSQEDLWGVNLYPFRDSDSFVDCAALINIKPHQNNFSMEVEDERVKEKIKKVLKKLIKE